MTPWEFWIDVGGTFTDCIARAPDDMLHVCKVLSSGITKGRVETVTAEGRLFEPARTPDPAGFWSGYEIRFLDASGATVHAGRVLGSEDGTLVLDGPLPAQVGPGTRYELRSGDEAPILAIRTVLGLRRDQPVPRVSVKLGTTRGTNALLTRTGARTAFITTRGFADVLRIGNQDRPRLFDLAIRKPPPLFERVVEIDERLAADGTVLTAPDPGRVRAQLLELKETGVESVAACLLHSFTNPAHEQLVERIAREVGFDEISTSSRLAPLIKIVSRGDTTVMDAYLNPVLREYVGRLRSSLASKVEDRGSRIEDRRSKTEDRDFRPSTFDLRPSTLKLMTSAGGLVDAERFVGKDSVLSGPAGGVIGFSRVAQRAGFARSIGFDMGGTSTDVSRFDGQYELEYETQKAGVRVVAPMLAIETVAAGGGSVCGFDGVKLFVGPASAGADPGPACYGRGGPLTVTDVNLHLGRLLPSRFPFPLDRTAVAQRLQELCDLIAGSPLGTRYTPRELAEGFVAIANATMVRAVRKISVARGYDPADYVLVTFGGAGAQHACALARELGIGKVLSHPYAGILSAYGIGLADVRRFREQAVLQAYSVETLSELEPLFQRLEREATAEVQAEGVPPDHIRPPRRSLDMRYRGVDATINVPLADEQSAVGSRQSAGPEEPDDARCAQSPPVPPPSRGSESESATGREDNSPAAVYERLHEQLYGYRHHHRAIEIVAARVEVVGVMPDPPDHPVTPVPRVPTPAEQTQTCFGGELRDTGVYLREQLHPGDVIAGPAILVEPTSTVVVEPDFTAEILSRGEVLLEDRRSKIEDRTSRSSTLDPRPSTLDSPDPVLLEIFNNLFASIAEQMGITLQRTSFSTNVKERLDFSCAIFSPQGDLVVNAPHIPVHLGAMSETVRRILADNPEMRPGDVFVTNDPYRGGSHLPDVTVVTPVFECGVRSAECGMEEGFYSAFRTPNSALEDSALRTPHSALLFFTASRAHHAEIGGIVPGSMPPFSTNLAEEGVLIRNVKLIDGGEPREDELRRLLLSGPHPTRSVEDNLADVSAQVAANRSGVRQLRELVERYSLPVVQAYMQHIQRAAAAKMRLALAAIPDGEYALTDHLDDGSPIAVKIAIRGETATVDFTGTGPVLPSNLNANRAIVSAAVLYVFRCLIDEDIPLNSGVLEPVEIVLPECLLNPPEHDDPSQCAAVVGGNVETSQRVVDTLLGALRVAAASQGTMNNLTFGDATFGYYETICGGSGATPDAGGTDAVHTHMTNTRLTDPEVIERRYPVRVREFAIRRGSGGAGRQPGGCGAVRTLEFLRPLKVSMLSERRGPFAPFGLDGGEPGALGRNLLQRAGSDERIDLGGKFAIDVQPGDVLIIETPGGGGCGRPS